jgi:hypothetical protein
MMSCAKTKVKIHRWDSLALAELLRNNYIAAGYICPIELLEARDLARRRMNIVKKELVNSGSLRWLSPVMVLMAPIPMPL